MAGARCAERFRQLRQIADRIVRFGGHAEILGVKTAFGIEREGSQEVVPDEGEQTEIHITDTWPLQVMEAVPLIEGQDFA